MARKRRKLVPDEAVECFELRVALYLTGDGNAMTSYEISTPDEPEVWPPLHELLGLLRMTERNIQDTYQGLP
jgi:hypothetical protein